MKEWRKPSVEATNQRYIVAYHNVDYANEDGGKEIEQEMDILSFDGIKNVWFTKGRRRSVKYKDIIYWIPIPKMPN